MTYWDASAVINAAVSPEVLKRLDQGEHVARLHMLAEFFAIMTGRGIDVRDEHGLPARVVLSQNECAVWLRKFADKLQFQELTPAEALDSLDQAQSRSVQGAKVYDYWHLLVASKARADEVLTRNTKHFEALSQAISGRATVQWP